MIYRWSAQMIINDDRDDDDDDDDDDTNINTLLIKMQ